MSVYIRFGGRLKGKMSKALSGYLAPLSAPYLLCGGVVIVCL